MIDNLIILINTYLTFHSNIFGFIKKILSLSLNIDKHMYRLLAYQSKQNKFEFQ